MSAMSGPGEHTTQRIGIRVADQAAVQAQASAPADELLRHLDALNQQQPGQQPGRSGTVALRPSTAITRPQTREQVHQEVSRSVRIAAGQRARRLPYLATSVTASTGWAAWGVERLAVAGAGPVGGLLTTCATAAACALGLAGIRVAYRQRIEPPWRRRWWAAGATAAGWVSTASAVGPAHPPMAAALALGATACSAKWLRAHEVPTPHHDTLPAPLPPSSARDADTGAELERLWAENIGAARKVLPEALLTGRTQLPHAISWTVRTVPGTTSFSDVFARRDRIAAGLRRPAVRVLLEPSQIDESHATLTVITRDVLAAGIAYTGPRYQNGRIALGPYADGNGEAHYIAYDRVGVRNGMASGEPGSGKSAFLEAVGLGLKSSGEWVVWFGDGDPEAGSSPLLNELADWPEAGPEQVLAQLEALEALLEVRGLLKSTLTAGPDGTPIPITDPATQRPIRELRPCPAFPGYMWIVDEFHRLSCDPWLIQHKFIPRVERLVRIGRKYGVGLLTGSQSLLAPDFGNSTPLRGFLAAVNLFAFRNGNKSEKAVVSGLEISPSILPAGGGYAFSAGGGRLAMMRVAWSPDMARYLVGLPGTTPDHDSDLATARYRPATAPDPAATYTTQLSRLAAWRAHQHSDTTQATQSPPPLLHGWGDLGELSVPAALSADNVIPLRTYTPPPTQDNPLEWDDTLATVLEGLSERDRTVHAALRSGCRRTGQIAELTALRLPAVCKALASLAELDLAQKLGHGEWTHTCTPEQREAR
jgi:hypothetical protein